METYISLKQKIEQTNSNLEKVSLTYNNYLKSRQVNYFLSSQALSSLNAFMLEVKNIRYLSKCKNT